MIKHSVAIIGAGIAGLALARRLSGFAEVTIFEKSRGTGGRMATRRGEHGSFDHGAQYFTIRDPAFHDALEPMLDNGTVQAWSEPLHRMGADGQVEKLEDRSPRFVAVPSMTALAKSWASALNFQTETQIRKISGEPRRWLVETEDERFGPFDWVISSAPAPQTAALMPFKEPEQAMLREVRMNGCFTMMIRLPDDVLLPFNACQVEHDRLSWIGANNSKPERDAAPCIIVHANNEWAQTHLDSALDQVRENMLAALTTILPNLPLASAMNVALHRWRYASVEQPLGEAFLLDEDRQLAACGDWCMGNRVEAAFISGHRLGDALTSIIKENAA
ncbi:NAD(P)/FAD-dependent oxidoreductase [Rhizobium oryzicola]|uniref:NAD(P)-binding protein n=1 Tax=Rhizobium oryzicola TaxID=1232668 RepID=A0ABT8SUV8_9HYPH|nr:FAD-dependent oxidoreductase [Rhizobium oryzicola]MDO1582207.1 NAD(P)-binding protein [Rhizobium oryzicola]